MGVDRREAVSMSSTGIMLAEFISALILGEKLQLSHHLL